MSKKSYKLDHYWISPNGCWNWKLFVNREGYGYITINSKNVRASRHYYEKYKGKIPNGLEIDHLCKNRRCVNPDHLEVVTRTENNRRSPRTKLTIEIIKEIRELHNKGISTYKLAKQFNVTRQNIIAIIMKETWII